MAHKDLHDNPFDEGTIAKLEIFEDYAQAWIPTFVMQSVPEICIFDFFAGTGYDKNAVPGSPIRILQKLREQLTYIFQKQVKVKLHLNEFEPDKKVQKKFELLKSACAEYLDAHKDVQRAIEIIYHNKNFEELFPELLGSIKQSPSLIYLDQNGVKFLSDKYLLELEKLEQTDFLYFVSSSYFKWLGNTTEFKKHVDLDINELKNNPYRFIHKNVLEQLRKRLPLNSKLKLYPFSIKKNTNIFGIIFGAKHPRAVEKFLSIAWKKNPINGNANFDIEDDFKKNQLDIFEGRRLSKIESFKETLRSKILKKELSNNFEVLAFAYNQGHIASHAADALKEMKSSKEIHYDSPSPLVTYDNVYRNKKKLEYKVLNHGAIKH